MKLLFLGLMLGFTIAMILQPFMVGPGFIIFQAVIGYYSFVLLWDEVIERCWFTE